jgi:WD40 repeat protein
MNPMNDVPRQTLKQILDQYGRDVCNDPRRCEALLRDFCGEYRREIFVLISALDEGVADDLRTMTKQLPFSVVLPRLAAELHETTALSESAARWAVMAWAEALDLDTGAQGRPRQRPQQTAGATDSASTAGFRLTRRWKAHEAEVGDIGFSPDGRQLASVGLDATARIWPVAATGGAGSAQETVTLKQQTGILTSVAWHPDGLTLALGSGDTGIYLWHWTDAGGEVPRLRAHTGGVTGVVFLPSGKLLASCGQDGTINLWDVDAGTVQASLYGHTDAVLGIAVTADGHTLASAGGWDRTVRVWDLAQAQELWALSGHTAQVTSVCFGLRDKILASGGWDESIQLWDPKYGKAQGQLIENGDTLHLISAIAVAPDGGMLAAGDWGGEVRLWDVYRKTLLGRLSDHTGRVRRVAFSPGGRWLASADDQGEICLWRAENAGRR